MSSHKRKPSGDTRAAAARPPQPESRGLDFFASDPSLATLARLYMDAAERRHMEAHFSRLGRLIGGELDDLAHAADCDPPVLVNRNRQGEDIQSVRTSAAYRRMEEIAYEQFELAALSHRPALGWKAPLSPFAKYTLQYLFAQSEFGLLCPVSMTDSLTRTLVKYADPALLERFLPGLLASELDALTQGAMHMTEKHAGSDVGATETIARRDGRHWRLWGQKWFCSNAGAELSLVLARPEGSGTGTRGLGLFLVPRTLPDGSQNAARIVRLKDKLGTRSMASGEVVLEGALAHLVGDLGQGFKQMTEMVNVSRLSNAVRSAGMMRRSVHEALTVALGREAFGSKLIELPLVRRQLIKMILPAEQALSLCFATADAIHRTDQGEREAARLRRILTPLIKARACRDARKVAGDAMEMRGGCGYIEEWIEPRLLRDAHLGSIWEGTTNIVSLDVIRAARKERAHETLRGMLEPMIAAAPGEIGKPLAERLAATMTLIEQIAQAGGAHDALARTAATALYNVTSAALFCDEARRAGDDLRYDLAVLVLRHLLLPRDPIAGADADDDAAQSRVIDRLVGARVMAA